MKTNDCSKVSVKLYTSNNIWLAILGKNDLE